MIPIYKINNKYIMWLLMNNVKFRQWLHKDRTLLTNLNMSNFTNPLSKTHCILERFLKKHFDDV